ncbi:unnamed protein product [Adineta steineri]|uniref:Uncharacterized protein n=1 Tax=Adineta steineri TaxID=433720 RepID=A0A819H1J1_9BILA|nr:unnamed protein product [Adineta steineri]CAF3895999.1 unnamed protein product [Adineta steineri]
MMPCGGKGYVDDFAYKYCEAYLTAQDEFKDITWQKGVRVCLQRTMLSNLQTSSQFSCSQISNWGFNSHFDCYMHPVSNSTEINFCHLTAKDIIKIGWIAKNKVFKQEVMDQFLKLIKECTKH